ncbi:hypothetical protein UNSWDHB_737 [Dehalobacter sp. UNSWDHB]|nr:hypothetical protein UNSWDHB_737 [Dehalobacter sp. UNSWDHB]
MGWGRIEKAMDDLAYNAFPGLTACCLCAAELESRSAVKPFFAH